MLNTNEEKSGVESEDDVVSLSTARAMHGLLNSQRPLPLAGDSLPPLWHWLAFLPRVAQKDLGPDGHPKRSTESRPDIFPQRMFAGARISFSAPAAIDQALRRRSQIVSSIEKSGRSGPLIIVTIENTIECGGSRAITESQDIVYRGLPSLSTDSPGDVNPLLEPLWSWTNDVDLDPTLLFRFSALTYNAHRIHYDRRYAQQSEGYPGLVVHGPLQAVLLSELCCANVTNEVMTSFEFRSLRPVFDGGQLHLRGRREGSTVKLIAFDDRGQVTMSASAILAPSF
jgi:3-methylfumaryl-CoA hydratase